MRESDSESAQRRRIIIDNSSKPFEKQLKGLYFFAKKQAIDLTACLVYLVTRAVGNLFLKRKIQCTVLTVAFNLDLDHIADRFIGNDALDF